MGLADFMEQCKSSGGAMSDFLKSMSGFKLK
jgi:hypothetical protein